MKQVIQNYRTGELSVVDVPVPALRPRGVLVRNHYSVVSLGTEKSMIDFAQKNLLGKALARPDLRRKVLDFAKSEGMMEAIKQSLSRLSKPVPLGYSCAGEVIRVNDAVDSFQVGDRVACFGSGFASHAEVVFVTRNLCAPVPKGVSLKEACFGGLGAIAMHAVRMARPAVGERIAIIGTGLLGLLAVQIARAAGCQVLAIDISKKKVMLAQRLGAEEAAVIGEDDVNTIASNFTDSLGLDSVVIFAATKSNEPIELAAEICRERGNIVVPGLVGLDIPREMFYEKELNLVVSRSFGPGFYDQRYEEKAIDYPMSYVRWTAKRNMIAFLDLLKSGRVRTTDLVSRVYQIADAELAYQTILRGDDDLLAVLLEYPHRGLDLEKESLMSMGRIPARYGPKKEKVRLGLIGAGDFAMGKILPIVSSIRDVELKTVVTATGISGRNAARKYGFQFVSTDYKSVLEDDDIDCVIIATRHNLHAKLVAEALVAGKDVFVEKPLAISRNGLSGIIEAYKSSDKRLMVGFNRRFSPFSTKARELLSGVSPLVINCRVNAGQVAEDSWVRDEEEGGGRIVGEVCHFIDLAQYLSGSYPVSVQARAVEGGGVRPDDNVAITLSLANGSLCNLVYTASGDPSFPRERIEIFGEGAVCVIDNFRSLYFKRGSKKKRMREWSVDRGHKNEFEVLFGSLRSGKKFPVQFESYVLTTLATFAIEESLREGRPIRVRG